VASPSGFIARSSLEPLRALFIAAQRKVRIYRAQEKAKLKLVRVLSGSTRSGSALPLPFRWPGEVRDGG
jgi:hypothetical protein